MNLGSLESASKTISPKGVVLAKEDERYKEVARQVSALVDGVRIEVAIRGKR